MLWKIGTWSGKRRKKQNDVSSGNSFGVYSNSSGKYNNALFEKTPAMKHEELLEMLTRTQYYTPLTKYKNYTLVDALLSVVKLHSPVSIPGRPEGPTWCEQCAGSKSCEGGRFYYMYPCPTIQAIYKELSDG